MDQTTFLWLVGQGVTIGLTGMGIVIAMHRNLVTKIEGGDNALHSRLNETRDQYVRRDDLDGHLNPIRNQIDKMDSKLDRILEGQRKAN